MIFNQGKLLLVGWCQNHDLLLLDSYFYIPKLYMAPFHLFSISYFSYENSHFWWNQVYYRNRSFYFWFFYLKEQLFSGVLPLISVLCLFGFWMLILNSVFSVFIFLYYSWLEASLLRLSRSELLVLDNPSWNIPFFSKTRFLVVADWVLPW